MESHTFDEWKARGFRVCKGHKATGRNEEGKATFTKAQVKPLGQGGTTGDSEYEGSWEEMMGGYWDNMDHLPGPF